MTIRTHSFRILVVGLGATLMLATASAATARDDYYYDRHHDRLSIELSGPQYTIRYGNGYYARDHHRRGHMPRYYVRYGHRHYRPYSHHRYDRYPYRRHRYDHHDGYDRY